MLAFETDVQHETAPSDPCKQVGLLLLSVIWYLVAWNILVGFPEGVYWHFLDPYNLGFDLPPVIVLIIAILSSLVLDIGAVQSVVSSHPNLVAALPPLLFALSAIPNVYARSTFLTFAAASLGWSATATIGAAPVTILREFGVPACLTASYTMLMLRWLCDSLDPFLQSPWMKVALGCEGILAVVIFSTCEGPRKSGAAGGSCKCDCRGWLPALSAGLMGGSALALCQTYLSTATQPAGSTLLMPSYILGLVSVALVGVITVVLSIASRHAPDWIESRLARCMGAYVPLMACVLQLYAGVSIELFGRIRGTGTLAYLGLLTLAGVFPFMLAFLAKGFDDAAKVGRTGTAVCVVGLVWAVFFLIYFAVLTGGSAPIGGALFKAKSWLLALMLGFLWCAGVACMQESSLVPSPYYSIAEQQHSHRAPNVSLLLLAAVSVVFFAVAVPIKTAFKPTAPELGYERSLVVVAYNIQQGFTLEGWPNVDCVTEVLRGVGADWVGLSESNAAHSITANNDVSLAIAAKLGMGYFPGPPGAVPSVDEGIISRLPFQHLSSGSLEVLQGCDACPTQTHIWARSVVLWRGVEVQLHSVHTEWFSDPSVQIEYIAEQIRKRFRRGPLILVGDFNLPQEATVRPYDTALRSLVEGTGLQAAGGFLDPEVQLPLPPTEFISGLHLDFIFYRGVELEETFIVSESTCSDHMPYVAKFRRPTLPR
mmetsp:Transcript_57572/g.115267  ORF Transcript_57572/g.115267 Transcript_57572/m.115267 type:complete len:710 (-) Transcript_57572:75-2204(-)